MENHKIQTILKNALSLQEVYISGDSNHFQIIAVGKIFNNMNCVKKHQLIYSLLMEYIVDNRIHALSIKAYSPQEWEKIAD